MGISLEWAGGSSAPPLTPNLTFPRGTAPGKEAGASQGTGPSPETPGRVLLNIPSPALCLERQFPADSPLPEPSSLLLNSLDLANPEEKCSMFGCCRGWKILSPGEFGFQTKFREQFLNLRFIPCHSKEFEGSPGSQVAKREKALSPQSWRCFRSKSLPHAWVLWQQEGSGKMRFQILKDKRQGSPPHQPLIPQHQDHVWKFLHPLNLLENKYGAPGPVRSLPLEVWAGIFGTEQPWSCPWVSPQSCH